MALGGWEQTAGDVEFQGLIDPGPDECLGDLFELRQELRRCDVETAAIVQHAVDVTEDGDFDRLAVLTGRKAPTGRPTD